MESKVYNKLPGYVKEIAMKVVRKVKKRYLLITGKKQNMQVLSHTFTHFST
jgi:hypothetical protein